jgi:hypothetical protein
VRPILEYGAACWDPYREGQINALYRVQNMTANFAYRRSYSNWGTSIQRRKIARIHAIFEAFTGEGWKAIGDRLQRPCYLSRVDHDTKIRNRRQKTDLGKHLFVNRNMQLWNQLPADALVSRPSRTTGKIIVLYIPIFMVVDSRREDKRFWTEW